MKITIVGSGYVGLVTGACLSDVGINVICVDIDQNKINNLKKGIIPIFEPGLDEIIKRNIKKERLKFSTNLKDSISDSQAVFISVGTPPRENGEADLKYVLKVASEIGNTIDDYLVVVTKSTVPIKTSEKVREAINCALKKRGKDIHFDMVSNPEFLKEGDAINDFMKPDRIVIGLDSVESKKVMDKIYRPFTLNGNPIIYMDIPSAEMTKYASNAMLATRISFMNEIANLSELVGADVNMVRKGVGSDPRIGSKFIYPGIGYGGSCFPKDVKALARTGRENKYPMRILEAVELVNEDQKIVLFNKIKNYFGQQISGKTIAFWGLSFKPKTDDMREAPSLVIADLLIKEGVNVRAFDPEAMEEAKIELGDSIVYCKNELDAVMGADALALITEWPEFRTPNWGKIGKLMNNKLLFDGRNLYNRENLRNYGFEYFGIGIK